MDKSKNNKGKNKKTVNDGKYQYEYLDCKYYSNKINPYLELIRISYIRQIQKRFNRIIRNRVIKYLNKTKKKYSQSRINKIVNNMFLRWIFSQYITNIGCQKDPLIPYNADSFDQIREDLRLLKLDKQTTESIIEKLKLREICNKKIERLEEYDKEFNKNTTDYEIKKKKNKNNIIISVKYYTKVVSGDNKGKNEKRNNSITIHKKIYDRLCLKYINISTKTDIDYDIDLLIWSLYNRYNVLKIAGLQLAIPPELYGYFHNNFDMNFELFASAINAYSDHFCSVLYDIEKYFGSRNSFFDLKIKKGTYGFNPPFSEDIMNISINQILDLIKQSDTELTFIITLPVWDIKGRQQIKRKCNIKGYEEKEYNELDGLRLLNLEENEKYFIYKKIFCRENFKYYDYISNKHTIAAHTYFMVLSNNKRYLKNKDNTKNDINKIINKLNKK